VEGRKEIVGSGRVGGEEGGRGEDGGGDSSGVEGGRGWRGGVRGVKPWDGVDRCGRKRRIGKEQEG